jgi:hypothetical protein
MGRADHLELGDWNAVCSLCGFKRKASTMVRNWQGFYRCPEHNEPRHPQDFVRGEQDIQTVPWSQPPTETFVNICSFDGISAVPGVGLPGCMIPGRKIWSGGIAHGANLTFYILTENFQPLVTQGGDNLTVENIFVTTVPGAPTGVSAV